MLAGHLQYPLPIRSEVEALGQVAASLGQHVEPFRTQQSIAKRPLSIEWRKHGMLFPDIDSLLSIPIRRLSPAVLCARLLWEVGSPAQRASIAQDAGAQR